MATFSIWLPRQMQRLGTSRFSVYGPYFTLFWLGFAAHSIVRHRLMDIRVVISRTAAAGSTAAGGAADPRVGQKAREALSRLGAAK